MPDARILINIFHPNLAGSTGNAALRDAVSGLPLVTIRDLYDECPDWKFDVAREQQLLREHDVIVFQHPLYWGSSPALLREWEDNVLQMGFAFPPGRGDALKGRKWLQAVTVGGPEDAYRGGGSRFTVDELLRPFQSAANYCGMLWQKPFLVFGVSGQDSVAEHLASAGLAYRRVLEEL